MTSKKCQIRGSKTKGKRRILKIFTNCTTIHNDKLEKNTIQSKVLMFNEIWVILEKNCMKCVYFCV